MNTELLLPGMFMLSLAFLLTVAWTLYQRTGTSWINGRLQEGMGYRLSEVMIGAILGLGALVVYSLLSGLLDRALLETQPDDWFAQYVRSPDYYMDRAVYWLSWVLLAVLGLWFLSIASLSLQEPRTEANHNFFRNGLFAAAMILAVLGTITGYALIAWATPEVARWAVGAININVIILFTWCALFIIAGPVKESV